MQPIVGKDELHFQNIYDQNN